LTVEHVVVATDSMLIANAVAGEAVVWVDQDDDSWCGTQRIARALVKLPDRFADVDVVVNWQADEPEIKSVDVDRLVRKTFQETPEDFEVMTAVAPAREAAEETGTVKAIFRRVDQLDQLGEIQDFRRVVPPGSHNFRPHVGIYAMRAEQLAQLIAMAPSVRSIGESLEQLTWADNGWRIGALELDYEPLAINDAADYLRFTRKQIPYEDR
jgi:3-deoxy-manno-octulosonate cytidylyltransferase (CMP-KDO synthetase)